MNPKKYWERRKKLEQNFFLKLESLRKKLNRQFDGIDDFDKICESIFRDEFSEYYEVIEG